MKVYILLILLIGFNSFAQTICSDANLPTLTDAGLNAFSENEFTKSFQGSSITVIGEIHFYTDLKPRLDFIQQWKQKALGKKCVAYEWAKKEYDFVEFMNRIKKNIDAIKGPAYAAGNPQLKVEDIQKLAAAFEQIYNYYWPMAELTQNLNMKAVMVDSADHNFTSSKSMDERNLAMAENLNILLKSGECDSILFFVGKAHLAKNTDSSTRVQDLARSLGISVNTINLQMTNETVPYAVRSWSICPISQSLKLADYAFLKNDQLVGDYTLFPYMMNDLTRWKDFDYTLLVP